MVVFSPLLRHMQVWTITHHLFLQGLFQHRGWASETWSWTTGLLMAPPSEARKHCPWLQSVPNGLLSYDAVLCCAAVMNIRNRPGVRTGRTNSNGNPKTRFSLFPFLSSLSISLSVFYHLSHLLSIHPSSVSLCHLSICPSSIHPPIIYYLSVCLSIYLSIFNILLK